MHGRSVRGRWKASGGPACPSRGSTIAGRSCRTRREGLPPRCSRHGDESAISSGTVHTLLIDNYDSYTYNLFQQLAVINEQPPFVVYNDDCGGDVW